MHYYKGDYDKGIVFHTRALAIREELGDKRGMENSLYIIGAVHYYKEDYEKAKDFFEKSLTIQKEIGLKAIELETTTYLYLTYKNLSKEYDEKEIHTLIKETENIEYEINLYLYQLLGNKSYLDTAYNQVQEKMNAMDEELKEKFINYPIPKQIIEVWEKVKVILNE